MKRKRSNESGIEDYSPPKKKRKMNMKGDGESIARIDSKDHYSKFENTLVEHKNQLKKINQKVENTIILLSQENSLLRKKNKEMISKLKEEKNEIFELQRLNRTMKLEALKSEEKLSQKHQSSLIFEEKYLLLKKEKQILEQKLENQQKQNEICRNEQIKIQQAFEALKKESSLRLEFYKTQRNLLIKLCNSPIQIQKVGISKDFEEEYKLKNITDRTRRRIFFCELKKRIRFLLYTKETGKETEKEENPSASNNTEKMNTEKNIFYHPISVFHPEEEVWKEIFLKRNEWAHVIQQIPSTLQNPILFKESFLDMFLERLLNEFPKTLKIV